MESLLFLWDLPGGHEPAWGAGFSPQGRCPARRRSGGLKPALPGSFIWSLVPSPRPLPLAAIGALAVGLILPASAQAADSTPPQVAETVPAADAVVRELTFVEVVFDENVTGVDAADFRINGQPAGAVEAYSPRDYSFTFSAPAPGLVRFTWAAGHGITDLAVPANAFAASNWSVTLDPTTPLPRVVISEFVADNEHGLRDDFANRSDWIELRNLESDPVDLAGWFLSDDAAKPTKWRFPTTTLAPQGYLLVWASEQDRTNSAAPLHTNFKLGNSGEYLGLRDAKGQVVSEFKPAYPAQQADVSYGRTTDTPEVVGYFPAPTPGAPNSAGGPGFAPEVTLALPGGVYATANVRVPLSAPSGTIRYTIDGTVPTGTSPAYSTPLVFSRSTVLHARAYQNGLLPGPVVVAGYELIGTGLAGFSSKLPLLILNTGSRAVGADARTPAFVTAIEPFRGRAGLQTAPQFQGRAQTEYRGQSSMGFPKKAYNLELNDAAGLDLEAPLLGLPAESDWVLYNPYSDKPFLQNFLAYELHEQMGHYAPRRLFVELFVDSSGGRLDYPRDYAGVYLLVEKLKVDANRVDIARLSAQQNAEPEISGGYMIKKDKDSPGDRGFSTAGGAGHPGQYLKFHEPKPREITVPQQNWIRNYVSQFEQAMYAADWLTRTGTRHYSHYIDVDSFVDNHWIVEFPKQIDGYRLSNYLHKDRGGKLKMDPIWDWNLSFGNADYLEGANPAGWYHPLLDANAHLWLRRLINGSTSGSGTTGDPDFNQRIADRWSVLRTNIFAASNVLARVDELAAYLTEAAGRDFTRWPRLGTYIWPNPPLYSQPTTYAGIIANMKDWIRRRYDWIDTQYLRSPQFSLAGGGVSPGMKLGILQAAGTVYYTTDGSDPRGSGGGVAPGAAAYSAPFALRGNSRVVARVRAGTRWSGPTAATFVVETPRLLVTELMFHPAPPPAGSTNEPGDFEYIELKNAGPAPLDLRGFRFVEGIQFSFATGRVTTLAPDARVVVVKNLAAFTARHGTGPEVAGEFTGSLANEGERLRLVGPMEETVADFAFDPEGQPAAGGHGFALVLVDETQDAALAGAATGWRTGTTPGGTPGLPEPPAPVFPAVVINEVLAHTDPPLRGAIELHNPSAAVADLSGWFLTDDRFTPKFRLPDGTVIPPGGFALFTELDFNPAPGVPPSFNLRASGDEVFLLSADAAGRLTGYVQGWEFAGSLNGESFGRHVTSEGRARLVRQASRSLGAVNAGPQVGPVLLSEILFHPPDIFTNAAFWDNAEHEFIELHNAGATPVPLFDPNAPTNTWRLRDAVRFAFPTNQFLSAGERLLVVGFDPVARPDLAADFRAKFNLATTPRLFGPWEGKLANDRDSVELIQPDLVRFYQTNEVVTAVVVDRVHYRDESPWPLGADGLGGSLQRRTDTAFGDDPASWVAATPTPGAAWIPSAPPVITVQPAGQTVPPGTAVVFQVEAGPGTLWFQWRRDGANLAGATNAMLTLPAAQPTDAGAYQVVVGNTGTSTDSAVATLIVASPPVIVGQPVDLEVRGGASAEFTVVATGSGPLRYQWHHGGQPVPGATRASLTLPNASKADEGAYDVVVTDGPLSVRSRAAALAVFVEPVIVQHPLSQTGARGGSVTLSVAVTNTADLPVGYQWEKDGTVLARRSLPAHEDFLTLGPLQPGDAGGYRVVVISRTLPLPGLASHTAQLTVVDVPDADGDGLPDAFERDHGLDPHVPADAAQDTDRDGASNLEEFLAGTDPRDPLSVLAVERILARGTVSIHFLAVADRSYTVLYRDDAESGAWRTLASVPAVDAGSTARRPVTVEDPAGPAAGHRYYRLVTPGMNAR